MAPDEPAARRLKVLVVDDDPVVLDIIEEVLTEAGYDVDVREQALGTAQLVAQVRPDFVVLDVNMPALSGAELTQLIRRRNAASTAAVILHSSKELDELNAIAKSSGALGAIKKNANMKLFLYEFERLVAKHRATRGI